MATIEHQDPRDRALPETGRETFLWHSQAHMPTVKRKEIVLARGEGSHVWDEEGHRLLDAPASLWYCNVGHGRREISDAVAAQMATLETFSTFQRFASRPAMEIAQRLATLVPIPNAKVFLGSGGGDAVEVAVKIARLFWTASGLPQKTAIVTREKGYHGLHGFGTSITGLVANQEGLGPLMSPTFRVPTDDADALEVLFRQAGDQIAAFFCEPVIGTGGVLFPPPGYLERVRELCTEYDVIFVADEVITGFGRTGSMFACERFGIQPDLMLLAKGLTSGYLPMGATVIGERYWQPFWNDDSQLILRHGLTYAGHASACAAAQANLDILEREKLVARVRELESHLSSSLEGIKTHRMVKEVRSGIGLLAGVQLYDANVAQLVADHCFDEGVLMRVISDATLQISPPFIISEEEIDYLSASIEKSLDTVTQASE